MTEPTDAPEEPGPEPGSLHMRPNLRWFAAEFIVVVSGVLVALLLNAWWQDRQDHTSEAHYLSLLSQDLQSTIDDLDSAASFEGRQLGEALLAYKVLSEPALPDDTLPVSLALARLGSRRTLVLSDATYEDLVHTGNLRIIGNRKLRSQIVDFYGRSRRWLEVINKNNAFFVDDMYNTHVIYSGLVMPRRFQPSNPRMDHAFDQLSQTLADGYTEDVDRLWTLPRNTTEWSIVRNNLMSRYLVAGITQNFEHQIAAETRELKAAVDAELASR